jgi:hypothetical protein
MQQYFTKDFMLDNCGCYNKNRHETLLSCFINEQDSITLVSIFNSEIPLKDKYWFLCKILATKEENQQIAIRVAEIVLPIFEKRYPDDKRPREAIGAAKAFIIGHISLDKLIEKRRAADTTTDAADAATYAIYATDATAAYAAAAAVTATYAATAVTTTYAAAATVTATYVATYAADAATYAIYATDATDAATYAIYATDATTYATVTAAYIKQQLLDYLLSFCASTIEV